MTNTLPIDNGLGNPWFPDVQCLREVLQGLLVEEQAEEGGVAAAGEEDEEEQRGALAGGAVPL